MQIRTHSYAERAYPLVEAMVGNDLEKEYRTLALNFPTMIMQAGLAQAIGFLKAKGEKEHIRLLEHISEIMKYKNLHEAVIKSDVVTYQLLTRQALDASSWLKRYTQALLSSGDE